MKRQSERSARKFGVFLLICVAAFAIPFRSALASGEKPKAAKPATSSEPADTAYDYPELRQAKAVMDARKRVADSGRVLSDSDCLEANIILELQAATRWKALKTALQSGKLDAVLSNFVPGAVRNKYRQLLGALGPKLVDFGKGLGSIYRGKEGSDFLTFVIGTPEVASGKETMMSGEVSFGFDEGGVLLIRQL